jgi:hypothetical protein
VISWRRADLAGRYLELRFHLRNSDIGVVALLAQTPQLDRPQSSRRISLVRSGWGQFQSLGLRSMEQLLQKSCDWPTLTDGPVTLIPKMDAR